MHAEADAYYCFSYLICLHQDLYKPSQDQSSIGIHGRLSHIMNLLSVHDTRVYYLLQQQKLDVSYYGLRWLTTFLSREFNLADTIILWDSLFADKNQNEFLSYFCMTMIVELKDILLYNDFANNLQCLQNYPSIDLRVLIKKSYSYRNIDFHNDIENKRLMFMSSIANYPGAVYPSQQNNLNVHSYDYYLSNILFADPNVEAPRVIPESVTQFINAADMNVRQFLQESHVTEIGAKVIEQLPEMSAKLYDNIVNFQVYNGYFNPFGDKATSSTDSVDS
jgi:hypothetical protein